MWPECPQCDSQNLRIIRYDYGTCSQAGYRDAGERWECRTCGAIGDGDELGTQSEVSVDKRSIKAAINGRAGVPGPAWRGTR
jgi:ribosomal protein L37AE/L43A